MLTFITRKSIVINHFSPYSIRISFYSLFQRTAAAASNNSINKQLEEEEDWKKKQANDAGKEEQPSSLFLSGLFIYLFKMNVYLDKLIVKT